MYCEYWKLNKPPFDNVPDPSMYVDCHASMENVISETIFAIKEANECFAVIIGEVGLGKTLSLRIIIDSLESGKYKIALITNPSISFVQLLREIIGQITGKQCIEKNKVDLLEIFNRLLFETSDKGEKIVIFIDEANALSPANLENLRLLTNMQDDTRNLFTMVLAGQIELARRLEHPKRANLFQRIGTYGRIDKLPSEQATKTYIETRLKLAGAQKIIFTDDAIPVIWEYSEYGVPRLINKICKLCLKAGETNEFTTINAEVTTQVADRFQKLSKTALQKRKPRSRPDIDLSEEEVSFLSTEMKETSEPLPDDKSVNKIVPGDDSPTISGKNQPEMPLLEAKHEEDHQEKEQTTPSEKEFYEEMMIGKQMIKLTIPGNVIEQAKTTDRESKSKLAGYWAAQIIKENPNLTDSPLVDPVSVWHDIKDVILKKINISSTTISTSANL
jgi:type II secretory pathway predicted ATPase ExeA